MLTNISAPSFKMLYHLYLVPRKSTVSRIFIICFLHVQVIRGEQAFLNSPLSEGHSMLFVLDNMTISQDKFCLLGAGVCMCVFV